MPTDPPLRRRPVWLEEPAIARIVDLLGDVRFVGGCVRDLLLGRAVADLDLATPLPPQRVMAIMADAGIRTIATGLAHGTVTVLAAGRPLEVTTLRRDVATDGRHATVAFTDDWAEDAARRDFTMNALFLAADGTLTDSVGGLADLERGQVRFIGDPARRIDEDLLRILRFYRFQAGYGRAPADAAARAACAARAADLDRLSAERIQAELLKLLALPDPRPTVRLMAADGVLDAVLQGAVRLDDFERMVALDGTADPLRRLATLALEQPWHLGQRLRLSAAQIRRLQRMPEPIHLAGSAVEHRALLHRAGPLEIRDRALFTAARDGGDPASLLVEVGRWQAQPLPVSGEDLLALGQSPGPAFGALLRAVEAWWLAHDRVPDRAACLAELQRRIENGR